MIDKTLIERVIHQQVLSCCVVTNFRIFIKSMLIRVMLCVLTESCIYGDYRGRFHLDADKQLNCTEIGVQQPWRCYDNSYVTDCCQTCDDVRNTSLPVGEFDSKLYLLLFFDPRYI